MLKLIGKIVGAVTPTKKRKYTGTKNMRIRVEKLNS